ncbi:PREDICTED: general odorant-binding protein 72-like [Nicrophorus vespilloides]|uniref:General odorant-binding protein 72-like n=1 Tax=Nicrophorus vespilloides TaxID=110193 RepID=A0ABM1N8X5_NICVS|nr:PREDICTED: general odorant-binding protein 72-like [Nicrophorus vespilloides]
MSKVVILFILAFATTGIFCADSNVPAVFKVIAKSLRASCLAETGADEDIVNAVNKGEFVNDEKMWCYLKCIFKKMGTIKGDTIDTKKLANGFPEKIRGTYAPGIKHCKDNAPVGADICETVFLFNKCLYEHNPEIYFIF